MSRENMHVLYKDVAKLMLALKESVALTGAGVSAESGIDTFRSKDGLWKKYDPSVYASIEVFKQDPSKYWTIRGDFIRNYDEYHPNQGHYALAELENVGLVRSVITQNIDGLHTKAGSKKVFEIHGSLRETYCLKCGKEYVAPNVPEGVPPYCGCGGILKPNTVLFGESLSPEVLGGAYREAQECKLMLVIGTSAVVQPAASLPLIAKEKGSTIIEINIEKAFPLADFWIREKSGVALPKIVEAVRKLQ
jgi:NAD-dependent deacetylase